MPFAGAIATCSIVLLLLLRVPFAEGQSSEETSEAFTMERILSENECGAFAGLVAATPAAGEAFRAQIAGDDGGAGLTVFCPDDDAVAAFGGPGRFGSLSAEGQAALLLYHGVATLYSEEALGAMFGREVATLANGPGDYDIRIYGRNEVTMILSSSPDVAGVTKMVVDNDRLAVYLIDSVLVPGEQTALPDLADAILVLLFIVIGIALLVLLSMGLVCLVEPLIRSCRGWATTYVSAARVAPQG